MWSRSFLEFGCENNVGGKNQTIDYHNAQNLSRLYLEAFQPVEKSCKVAIYRSIKGRPRITAKGSFGSIRNHGQ